MEYRRLGSSPVTVSQIGLGTWGMSGAFWGEADDAESVRVIHRALKRGVTLIDTAEAYGKGPFISSTGPIPTCPSARQWRCSNGYAPKGAFARSAPRISASSDLSARATMA